MSESWVPFVDDFELYAAPLERDRFGRVLSTPAARHCVAKAMIRTMAQGVPVHGCRSGSINYRYDDVALRTSIVLHLSEKKETD